MRKKYYLGPPPRHDDFGSRIVDEFIDGKTLGGPWAYMTPANWTMCGVGRLGTGFGQRFKFDPNAPAGKQWPCVEG